MTRRVLIIVLALTALAVAAGTTAPPAAAAADVPCWKRLLNDWYDGRIDNAYPVRCYRDAIRNLPDDVAAYTEAREDIERALLAAIRQSGGSMDPDDLVPAQPPGSGRGGNGGNGNGNGDDDGNGGEAAPGGGDDEGGLVGFFRPSNADAIPLPLLVLAGLALALLAAAALGFAARRVQARRLGPPHASGGPPPPES